jgi:hypothetical protein
VKSNYNKTMATLGATDLNQNNKNLMGGLWFLKTKIKMIVFR